MTDRLLRDRDVAAMLGTTPGVAASILSQRGVHAVDFGMGRSRGRRWLESAVQQVIAELHAEHATHRVREVPKILEKVETDVVHREETVQKALAPCRIKERITDGYTAESGTCPRRGTACGRKCRSAWAF